MANPPSPASRRFVEDVLSHKPRDWAELSVAAKFRRECYAESLRDDAVLVQHTMKQMLTAEASMSNLVKWAQEIDLDTSLYSQASHVYLGARAATLEHHPGNFSDERQTIRRLMDATLAGRLIDNFLLAARRSAKLHLLSEPQRAQPGPMRATDYTTEQIFDKAQEILEFNRKANAVLRPQSATILRIVQEEVIVFPHHVSDAISQAMRNEEAGQGPSP